MKPQIALFLTVVFFSLGIVTTTAQEFNLWYHLDAEDTGIQGVSVDKAYAFLGGRKLQSVIVAVIDDGVDIDHPGFQYSIWQNTLEIAGNGIDEDGNGYVDDVHGWNYLVNPKGENITDANMEVTRLYRQYRNKYENADPKELDRAGRKEYQNYLKYKALYDEELAEANTQLEEWSQIAALYQGAYSYMAEKIGAEQVTMDALMTFESSDEGDMELRNFLVMAEAEGLQGQLTEAGEELQDVFKYHLNLDFNASGMADASVVEIVSNGYGNPEVQAANPKHGTHVAGIIAADRKPQAPIRGIAENALIMPLRAVPNGDERDKDIALAIRYAADNGARIINMSFGKALSPDRELVDAAIRYAASKDVLMIHAAGNDGLDLGRIQNFPDGRLGKKKTFSHWITVGAAGEVADSTYLAEFSNYGNLEVDVLAPGVGIWSLAPDSSVAKYDGTSMAAPVVSGIAAVIRGAYPTLTAIQVKELICESASDLGKLGILYENGSAQLQNVIRQPGTLSLYRALLIAESRYKN